MRKLALLLIVLAVGVLACSESDGTPAVENPPETETETGDPSNDPGSSGVLLTVRRSGGFAGITETMTVRSDGQAEIEGDATPPQSLEVPPELLNRLEEELQTLDWARAAMEPKNAVCSDCFLYEIRSGGQRLATTAMGQSGEELSDLLALVDEIFASGSSR